MLLIKIPMLALKYPQISTGQQKYDRHRLEAMIALGYLEASELKQAIR